MTAGGIAKIAAAVVASLSAGVAAGRQLGQKQDQVVAQQATISAPALTTADIAALRESVTSLGMRMETGFGAVHSRLDTMSDRISNLEGYREAQKEARRRAP